MVKIKVTQTDIASREVVSVLNREFESDAESIDFLKLIHRNKRRQLMSKVEEGLDRRETEKEMIKLNKLETKVEINF